MLSMSHLHLVPDTFGGIFQACTGKLPHMVSFEYIRIIVYQYALPTSLASDSPCHWNLGVKISNNVYKYFHFQYPILEESKLHERFQPEWYFVPTKHKIFKGVYFDVQQCSRKRPYLFKWKVKITYKYNGPRSLRKVKGKISYICKDRGMNFCFKCYT